MSNVPDKAGHEMTVGAWHHCSALDRAFRYQKTASKSLYQAHIRDLRQEINRLRWATRVSTFGDPSFRLSVRVRKAKITVQAINGRCLKCGYRLAWVLVRGGKRQCNYADDVPALVSSSRRQLNHICYSPVARMRCFTAFIHSCGFHRLVFVSYPLRIHTERRTRHE
jgi:hypothetical protein